MNLIVFNNPAGLPWQTNLCDVMLLTMFVAAVAYSVVQLRRGRRIYCALLAAATIYGLVLELAGMATLNMYKQGDFMVMINWPAFPLWHGTTMMPAYVVIFYPVFLFTGFKVVEAIGIEKRWQGAVTGGLFMIALDAPYIIEGNLRHVVWWTWNPNFEYFQFWVGWPLLDLCWQGIWDAVFIFIMLWAAPRIDGLASSGIARWSNAKAMGAFPPLAALVVLLTGPILMSPVTVVTALGGPQWPVVVMLVVGYCAVTVTALRSVKSHPSFEPFTLGLVVLYVASLGAMVIANVVYERGLTQYILVQAVGLIVVSGLALFPWIAPRRGSREPAEQPAQVAA
ncbi:hypothetical protein A5756_05610 [Mycobacterium sp. 852002-53434_SCH5985345]|uniref:hypothetical protein n=1 Tax=unclassified Mycobacterium TaxID=2642494 RepID=UPI0007FF4BDD|nr:MULTISPECIES: hypothetical protein [unclassified Mycobacterium]OBF59445.1 hypothetical protein A5756_05610 [Mycobacterium sp. 852002-53434_SCH5985345]OBF77482.1 hypothetical protein A5750_06065 [Mycobacterium sp. 852002-51613_SCH5001154]OBF90335.1 hypothetical protein A5773_02275 [Mycobacterium sp. 852014-52450_SCH5900713]